MNEEDKIILDYLYKVMDKGFYSPLNIVFEKADKYIEEKAYEKTGKKIYLSKTYGKKYLSNRKK